MAVELLLQMICLWEVVGDECEMASVTLARDLEGVSEEAAETETDAVGAVARAARIEFRDEMRPDDGLHNGPVLAATATKPVRNFANHGPEKGAREDNPNHQSRGGVDVRHSESLTDSTANRTRLYRGWVRSIAAQSDILRGL